MTNDERAELRELLGMATPGEWNDQFEFQEGYAIAATTQDGKPYVVLTPNHNMPSWREDMALAIAAHNALPAILDELDSKDREIERLNGELERVTSEREAAVSDLRRTSNPFVDSCASCKIQHNYVGCEERDYQGYCVNYEWRGLVKEADHA